MAEAYLGVTCLEERIRGLADDIEQRKSALRAAVVHLFGNVEQKTAYLKDRGWRQDGEVWHKGPYVERTILSAELVQVKWDLQPYIGILTPEKP